MTNDQQVPTTRGQCDAENNQHATEYRAPTIAKEERWRWPDIASLIFDGILTVTAIAGTFFLVGQSRQMQRSNDLAAAALTETKAAIKTAQEANEISRDAAERARDDAKAQDARFVEQLAIAKATADAARESVRVSEQSVHISEAASKQASDTFRLDERPWLLVSSTEINNFRWPDVPPQATVIVKNVGKTPAMTARFGVFMTLGGPDVGVTPPPPPLFLRFGRGNPELDRKSATVIIGPSVEASFPLTVMWTEAQAKSLDTGRVFITIQGKIQYSDLWGESHFTDYCTGYVNRAWAVCEQGNEAR